MHVDSSNDIEIVGGCGRWCVRVKKQDLYANTYHILAMCTTQEAAEAARRLMSGPSAHRQLE